MTTTETETREMEVIDLREMVNPYEETNDPNHRTHIINPAMNLDIQHQFGRMEDPQEIVDIARLFGLEITALCGFKLIPVNNPESYDACEACMKIVSEVWSSEG